MPRTRILVGLCASGALALGVAFGGTPAGAVSTAKKAAASPLSRSHLPGTRTTQRSAKTSAASSDFVVGVDAPTPAGHNIQYVDYFPRSGLTVNPGQVIDFTWDPGLSPDSFHSATLLASGHTIQSDLAANPVVEPEENNTESTPLFTPFTTFAPSDFSCGDSANPCSFDGTADLSSGATGAGSDFFVKVANSTASGTYTFHCRVHPFMQGSVTVATTAPSTASNIAAAAAAQYADDTAGILDAIDAANHGAYVTNADGTHHVTISAGTETQFAEALEMLPRNVRVAPGDTVTWKALEQAEIHTVTFPEGDGSNSVDPFLPPECEANPDSNPDTAADPTAGPPNLWCPSNNISDIEFPFDPAPHGSTTLVHPSDVASSGIISDTPGAGFPSQYSFKFDGNGSFHYMCRVHDAMVGTIFVAPSPGYLNVAADGGVFAHGLSTFDGSMGGTRLNQPVVGISRTPDPGYVLAAADGGIFAFGDAPFAGSMGGTRLNQPVVGVSETPSGGGYWMVASDGGVFSFGDAPFEGSTGNIRLNKPMVGMAPTPSGHGYWLVASDGGIFAFGDAAFKGSTGNITLNKPVVGMSSDLGGGGYWMVASDGGIFAFGDAPFLGSDAVVKLNSPMVGMASQYPLPSRVPAIPTTRPARR